MPNDGPTSVMPSLSPVRLPPKIPDDAPPKWLPTSQSFYAPAGTLETKAAVVSKILPPTPENLCLCSFDADVLPTTPQALSLVATLYRHQYRESGTLVRLETLLSFIRSARVKGSFQASGSSHELTVWYCKPCLPKRPVSAPASVSNRTSQTTPATSGESSRGRDSTNSNHITSGCTTPQLHTTTFSDQTTGTSQTTVATVKHKPPKERRPRARRRTTTEPQSTTQVPTGTVNVAQLAVDISRLCFNRAEHDAPRRVSHKAGFVVGGPPRTLAGLVTEDLETETEEEEGEDDTVSSLEGKAAVRAWNFGSLVRRGEFMERMVP